MNDLTDKPADRSREQKMLSTGPAGADPEESTSDWGIQELAVEPGEVQAKRSSREPRFESLPPNASTMFEKVILEQHVNGNDLRPAYWLEEGAARSRAVCKVDASGVDYDGRTGSWSGTGFLVAPGILCTNHHVINSVDVASRSRILFDFAGLPDGTVRQTSAFKLRPDKLFWTSPVVLSGGDGGFDVTFVAVDGEPGVTFGSFPLLRQSFAVADQDKLNIIQHPNGRLKEVAIRDNTLEFQDTRVVRYRSDTEPGSSGAPVMNDMWELVALHHAAHEKINEGIKFSAIAAALELEAQSGNAGSAELVRLFKGTDELMGFFGSLGRAVPANSSGMERVVDAYKGEDGDVDIGGWNIEWFNKRWEEKLDAVARIVVEMNLDVWVFVESSLEATTALANHLLNKYGTKEWGVLASQEASSALQITTVMWNRSTVKVEKKGWPEKVHRWFEVDSRQFDSLGLEAVQGKVFDRYPELFKVITKLGAAAAEFNLVPIHLKAKEEGSLRRQMASRLLAAAMAEVAKDPGYDSDWIIMGDANATLASGDLDALTAADMTALTATDAAEGQITYVKAPFKSLIDHVFLSRNLIPSNQDFAIVALDRNISRFLDVSDHRPLLIRLSAGSPASATLGIDATASPLTDVEVAALLKGIPRRDARTKPSEPVMSGARAGGAYYDAPADAAARDEYWKAIAQGTSDLTGAISERLRTTHSRPLSYEPSKHVYPWVDLRPNGKVQSIYSGFEATPEFFIQADAEVDRLRSRARTAMMSEGVLESTNLEAMLEAQFQYNCEHVVPQSWFSKDEPMRGDIHHLFACEPRCNSFRSNYPFVQHDLERTMQDCGRIEDDTFEPNGGKGAAARATLYFMLRYPGVIGRRYSGQRLQTLLSWHERFVPDEWERHRNAAIQELQGNRNPFIDHPEWATAVQFGI